MKDILTENEKAFVESIVNFEANVNKARKYIKENYNIDSTYDEEELTIHLICNNVNESLNLINAEEYLNETLENVTVMMG